MSIICLLYTSDAAVAVTPANLNAIEASQTEMENETENRFVMANKLLFGRAALSAWVNFDGTGAVSIRDSLNVSSITDNGNGDYTVNFTTAFATTDYCTTLGVAVNGTTSSTFSIRYVADSITTTSIQIRVGGTTVDSALNAPAVNVMCVGNL